MIESITLSCAPDYDNDPQIIKDWLANKTPENISQWINSKNNLSFAAVEKDKIVGFALMNREGEILLNYVLPSYLYQVWVSSC
ncbi:GNAT family N-acetyltransferase [Legionella longbeachae]|uniref:GNAT family N-acetyltransferase n=1 Tax=Legionella longbeachae TaxID=450 RepID=UPI0009B747D3|nr:GNAT family N-acetyltransferase [Legionella longbeachae]ARB91017.1 GNAT family N-acetyltransferase [Legionella longbeachae]UAK45782.1 GNAT family N-acetyltransferase [Legionella longbeachae]